MATPPFNLDIFDPTDTSIGASFTANERAFRDNVSSFLATEHDANTGYHKFQILTTAQRGALSNPPTGMVVYTSDATPATLFINTGTPATPVWASLPQQGIRGFVVAVGSSGAFTIPVPSLKVTGVGAGGGGGGGGSTTGAGGSGGSGSWFTTWLTGLTVGSTITYSVGNGGSSGAVSIGGGAGSQTQIASGTQTITTRTAPAGSGGGPGSSSTNGGPGTGGGLATGAAGDLLGSGNSGTNTSTGIAPPGTATTAFYPFGGGGSGGTINGAGTAGAGGLLIFEWVQ